jgi:hypothetical protein
MASERLVVPEQHLLEVAKVIRAGLDSLRESLHPEVEFQLEKWCSDMERYIN